MPVAIGQAVEYKLLEPNPGDWDLAFQKKMAAVWAGHKKLILDFSLSAHVLQRKPLRKPAQKQAVILYANKRVKYDLGFRSTLS